MAQMMTVSTGKLFQLSGGAVLEAQHRDMFNQQMHLWKKQRMKQGGII